MRSTRAIADLTDRSKNDVALIVFQTYAFRSAAMEKNIPAGVVAVTFSVFGAVYLVRALIRAFKDGFSPGKLGAIHQAGTLEYAVFVAGCFLGLVLMFVLALMGLRWMGFLAKSDN